MNPTSNLKDFHRYLRSTYPTHGFLAHPDWDGEQAHFESMVLSHLLPILQRDPSFFAEERIVFGGPLHTIPPSDELWTHIHSCGLACVLSGDIQSKLKGILETVKTLWSGQGHDTESIDAILNDESTQGKVSSLLEFVMQTRIASLAKQIIEELQTRSLGFSLTNPDELFAMAREGMNHPTVQTMVQMVQSILEQKLQSGAFTKEMLLTDFEQIKQKARDAFGDMVNGWFGIDTRADATPSEVLLSNHPDARRARMLARLQRKQKDKGRKTL